MVQISPLAAVPLLHRAAGGIATILLNLLFYAVIADEATSSCVS